VLLLFDSIEALGPAGAEAAWDAIGRLVSDNARLRAVVATRDGALTAAEGRSSWRLTALGDRQRLAFMRAAGLPWPARTLRRLRERHHMARVLDSPLLFGLLCRRLARSPGELPGGLDGYRLVGETLEELLARAGEQTWTAAADLARRMIGTDFLPPAEAAAVVPAPETLDTLLTREVLRRPAADLIGFRHQIFHEYFACRWLLARTVVPEAEALLADPAWRLPLVVALEQGSPEQAGGLLAAAERILADAAGDPDVIDDLRPYLDEEPGAHISRHGHDFRWPAGARQALTVLHESQVAIPGSIRALADRLIVSAVLFGTPVEQLAAVKLLPCLSAEAGSWVTQHVYLGQPTLGQRLRLRGRLFDGDELPDDTTLALFDAPHVFAKLPPRARLEVVALTVSSKRVIARGLARGALVPEGDDTGTLAGTMRALLSVLHRSAVMLLTIGGFVLFGALLTRDWPAITVLGPLLAIPASFLVSGVLRSPQPEVLFGLGTTAAIFALVFGLLSLLSLPGMFVEDPGAFAGALLIVAVVTWPGAMLLLTGLGSVPEGWHKVLPQLVLLRLAVPVVAERLRVWLPVVRAQLTFSVALRRIRRGLLPVLVVSAAVSALLLDLPGLPRARHESLRGLIVGGVLALGWLVARIRDQLVSRRARLRFSAVVSRQKLTEEGLLSLLLAQNRPQDAHRMIGALAAEQHQVLYPVRDVLADLAAGLSHVRRLVPADARMHLSRDLWDYAPRFRTQGFTEWLIAFDSKHPGRLVWLAGQPGNKAAIAADRAASPPPS
jgi:hypothetical protein